MKKLLLLILLTLFGTFFPVFAEEIHNINDDINIAFTIDNNYPIYTMLVMESILNHNTSNSHYRFHVVEDNLTGFSKFIMKRFAEYKGADIAFYRISTESFDEGRNFYTYVDRITPIGMARILLPSVLPKELKRVLYLDSDILVTTDLKPLYNTNLGRYSTGMIVNIQHVTYDNFNFGKYYFNSGVILMDLDKWRKQNIEGQLTGYIKNNWQKFIYVDLEKERAIEKAKEKEALKEEAMKNANMRDMVDTMINQVLYKKKLEEKTGQDVLDDEDEDPLFIKNDKFMYPDQDLINVVLNKRIKPLDKKWNMQYFALGSIVDENFKGIIHYIGAGKPWLFTPDTMPSYKIYHENWDNSLLVIFKPICWYKLKIEDKRYLLKELKTLYFGKKPGEF